MDGCVVVWLCGCEMREVVGYGKEGLILGKTMALYTRGIAVAFMPRDENLFAMVCTGVTLALLGRIGASACGELRGLGGHRRMHKDKSSDLGHFGQSSTHCPISMSAM
jgi:hypothetical protein